MTCSHTISLPRHTRLHTESYSNRARQTAMSDTQLVVSDRAQHAAGGAGAATVVGQPAVREVGGLAGCVSPIAVVFACQL